MEAERIKNIETWDLRYNVYIDIVSKIQRKRIAYGYSQEDLSILLGLPIQQVADLERFQPQQEYTLAELHELADIFSFNIKRLFEEHPKTAKQIKVGVYDWYENKDVHCFEAYGLNGETYELLYSFREEVRQFPDLEKTIQEIEECLKFLSRTGFFDNGVRFSEIFKYCKEGIYNPFAPKHVQKVLKGYLKKGAAHRLCRKKRDHKICYFKS